MKTKEQNLWEFIRVTDIDEREPLHTEEGVFYTPEEAKKRCAEMLANWTSCCNGYTKAVEAWLNGKFVAEEIDIDKL